MADEMTGGTEKQGEGAKDAATSYNEWAVAMQAYYKSAPPGHPTNYYGTPMGAHHPYMWGGQPMAVPHYGTSPSTPYGYGAMYPHPGMAANPAGTPSAYGYAAATTGDGSEMMVAASAGGALAGQAAGLSQPGAAAGSRDVQLGIPDHAGDYAMGGRKRRRNPASTAMVTSPVDSMGRMQTMNMPVSNSAALAAAPAPQARPPGAMGPGPAMGYVSPGAGEMWTPPAPVQAPAVQRGGRAEAGEGAVQAMTYQDERELKRQRRKQSNRESARRSRLRKQAECEDLAGKLEGLQSENTAMRTEVSKLQQNLKALAMENHRLHQLALSLGIKLPPPGADEPAGNPPSFFGQGFGSSGAGFELAVAGSHEAGQGAAPAPSEDDVQIEGDGAGDGSPAEADGEEPLALVPAQEELLETDDALASHAEHAKDAAVDEGTDGVGVDGDKDIADLNNAEESGEDLLISTMKDVEQENVLAIEGAEEPAGFSEKVEQGADASLEENLEGEPLEEADEEDTLALKPAEWTEHDEIAPSTEDDQPQTDGDDPLSVDLKSAEAKLPPPPTEQVGGAVDEIEVENEGAKVKTNASDASKGEDVMDDDGPIGSVDVKEIDVDGKEPAKEESKVEEVGSGAEIAVDKKLSIEEGKNEDLSDVMGKEGNGDDVKNAA